MHSVLRPSIKLEPLITIIIQTSVKDILKISFSKKLSMKGILVELI